MTRFTDIARWRPLGPGNPPGRMARHDIICLHTMVGFLASTDTMFKRNGYVGVESHFGIGGTWGSDKNDDLDGVAYQWVDTEFRADANLDGTHRIVSIETADNAPQAARDIAPWTPKQCATIIRLVAALCRRYDIPAELVADSKPGRRGIAYHRQGIDPWRVAGGEIWSKSRGKECPGDRRIEQIRATIIPGVRAALAGKTPTVTDQEGSIVAWNDQHGLTDTDAKIYGGKEGDKRSESAFLRYPPGVERLRSEQKASIKSLTAQLGALTATMNAVLAAVQDGGGLTAEQATEAARVGAQEALKALGNDLIDGQ